MPLYAKDSKMETKIEFVKHQTAKSVVLGYFRRDHPRISDEKLFQCKSEFNLFLGKKWVKPAKIGQLLTWVRQVGIWGYCNHKSRYCKEIHYWVGKRANRLAVMEFILHEVVHAGGFHSEQLACKLAGLGTFAYHVFETDFDGKMPFQCISKVQI